VESYKAIGVKHAVLTAKHGCGFLLWNTSTTLPDGTEYIYAVQRATRKTFPRSVIEEFVATTQAAGIGHGFYYSTGVRIFGEGSCSYYFLPTRTTFTSTASTLRRPAICCRARPT
jgi:alpha-L-fucosidase